MSRWWRCWNGRSGRGGVSSPPRGEDSKSACGEAGCLDALGEGASSHAAGDKNPLTRDFQSLALPRQAFEIPSSLRRGVEIRPKNPTPFHPHPPHIPHTGPVPHGYTARRGGERGRFRVFEADAASWMCPAIRAGIGFFQRERLPGFRARRRPGGTRSKAGSPRRAGPACISSDMARCPSPPAPRLGNIARARQQAADVRTAPRGRRRARR